MVGFLVGLFVGSAIGLFVMALAVAARRGDGPIGELQSPNALSADMMPDDDAGMVRCAWCNKQLGPTETHGICETCEARVNAEAALAHALVGLRSLAGEGKRLIDDVATIAVELERARVGIWQKDQGHGLRLHTDAH
jgi:hypothetical protein